MYRPSAFAVDDIAQLHAVIRERPFATLARVVGGEVLLAYAPVVLAEKVGRLGALRLHFAGQNPIGEEADGAQFHVSILASDAYISPDWYETPGVVPTWNYVAVEGRGAARKLDGDELRRLLVDLSAEQERKLLPKQPWTIDKVPEPKLNMLLGAIVGFEIKLEKLAGKFKLSQNLKPQDFQGALRGLESHGEAGSVAVASAMRKSTAP